MNKEEAKKLFQKIKEDAYKIEVQVLGDGKLPSKKNRTDAGFDVYATSDITLYPGQVQKHPLNIRCKLPAGTYMRVETKSGLGSQGQLVFAGIVDELYRGIPHVIMTNVNLIAGLDSDGLPLMRTDPIVIKKGEKVAQLIMHPYSPEYYIEQVELVDTNTARGEGGFGSTGK